MSIKTEITRLQNAKASIKTAIEGKGVTVPDGTKLDGMAALVDSISSGGGSSSETWVLNLSGVLTSTFTGISFVSNGETFSSITFGKAGFMRYLKYDSTNVCGGSLYSEGDSGAIAWESSMWVNTAYRKLTFSTPPSGDLLTWLEANAVKQANDTAVQTDKALTITSNGTTEITPDVPYDAMSKVNVTANISGGFPNGTVWTRSNVTMGIFRSVVNANGLWVAGGDGTGLYYSVNGKTWTQSNITNDNFNSVVNANGLWVACCDDAGLYYSVDGKTWTESNTVPGYFDSVANANGLWVAGNAIEGLYYSVDGKTWTHSNVTSDTVNSVVNANGLWVAGSDAGLYYSVDGKAWTQSNVTTGSFTSVVNANGLWVAGSNYDAGLYYSVNGKTWTQSNIAEVYFNSVANANGLWVAGCDAGLYYSVDGKAWTQSNVTTVYFNSVVNANGLWVAGSDAGLYYSVSWEPA